MYFGFTYEWGMAQLYGRWMPIHETQNSWSPWCIPDVTDFSKIWSTTTIKLESNHLHVYRDGAKLPVGHGYVMLRAPPATYGLKFSEALKGICDMPRCAALRHAALRNAASRHHPYSSRRASRFAS